MKADLDASFRRLAVDEMPRLRRYALAISGDPHRADDLVQGALERLYVVWPRMHRAGDPAAYLRTVLTRLAISESRRPWRRRERTTEHLPEPDAAPDGADRAALRLDLLDALAGLTVKQRAIVVLRYLEDLSVRDVAEQLDISEGTVKRQSSDAVAHLRRRLAGTAPGAGGAAARPPASAAATAAGAAAGTTGDEVTARSGTSRPGSGLLAPDAEGPPASLPGGDGLRRGADPAGAGPVLPRTDADLPDGGDPSSGADVPADEDLRTDEAGVDVTPHRDRSSWFSRSTEGARR